MTGLSERRDGQAAVTYASVEPQWDV
jgi:hypothetical protein